MAIIVDEKFDSRETTDGESVDLIYAIRGTDDEIAAMTELKSVAPASYNGMMRGNCSVEYLGPEMWLGNAPYKSSGHQAPVPLQTGESSFSFDTGGGTQHITQAIKHIDDWVKAGTTKEDFEGAIGVGGDGNNLTVDGVDIGAAVFNFTETHILPDSIVTVDYKRAVRSVTWTTNSHAFKGFDPWEVLFMGVSGGKRGGGDWELTFRFAVGEHKMGWAAIPGFPVVNKGAWQYLWVRYATKLGSKRWVKPPKQILLDQVYHEGDFSKLKIGV